MFERFTDKSRRALVLAQEEARLLGHNYIGTEHLLLGLIRQGDGVAAQALASLGINLEAARVEIEETIGPAGTSTTGSPPFTPRANKVMELSLREALQLGHNYIGTEHLLLGLVRDGEGVAAQMLVILGADLSRVRQRVTQLVNGVHIADPEIEGEGRPAPAARPRCGSCSARLSKSARYTPIEAAPGDQAVEGEGPLTMALFYCGRCGSVIGAPVEAGPNLVGPVTSTVRTRPPAGRSAEPVRRFPDELLAPVRLEDVVEDARVDLSYGDNEVIEGTVAGTAVRLTGRVGSYRGPLKGTWGDVKVSANWRLGDNSVAPAGPLPGIITGNFGDSPFKLKGYFRRSSQYFFEQAEIIGDLCGQLLRIEVSAAEGGPGWTGTVVADGTLDDETFVLFAALSGDLTRGVVRGSLGGRSISLDVTRNRAATARIVGDYVGPTPLLALLVGTLTYFL